MGTDPQREAFEAYYRSRFNREPVDGDWHTEDCWREWQPAWQAATAAERDWLLHKCGIAAGMATNAQHRQAFQQVCDWIRDRAAGGEETT